MKKVASIPKSTLLSGIANYLCVCEQTEARRACQAEWFMRRCSLL